MLDLDYETSLFLNDCKELSVDGVIFIKDIISVFWEMSPDLKALYSNSGINPNGPVFLEVFISDIFPSIQNLFIASNLTVRI